MVMFRRRYAKPGSSPGHLTPLEKRLERVHIRVFSYDAEGVVEREVEDIGEALAMLQEGRRTWIDVIGLHELEVLEKLGARFDFHPLSLEDVLNVGQRPKLEDYGHYEFAVMRLLRLEREGGLHFEQVSMFLGPDYVLTLQEGHGDPFDPVRQRLRDGGKGRIRKLGSDYLLYALIDAVVDEFFPVLEALGERIEDFQEQLVEDPSTESLHTIFELKKDLLQLRRAAWPQRDLINGLERLESPLVRRETQVFLRDTYDHCIQIMDMIESFRDLGNGLMELYLSSVAQRTNEVMKVLTIMASIFIPLTFIAGIYGMNFSPEASPWNMPELGWYLGYPMALGAMVVLGLGMFLWFRHKNWI